MNKSNLLIPDERKKLFKERLPELIHELLWYYNRLRLEQSLINYEHNVNHIIRKTISYSPLNMLISNTDEPGMTKEDISRFNTKTTEDYSNFIDRFCEFFEIYGITLLNYDTGDTYIVVQNTEKYLELLIEMKEAQEKNAKYLVRAVDKGIIENKKHTYTNSITTPVSSEIKKIDDREKKYFKHIPKIIDLHNHFDPNPPEENFYLRKRILGYDNALKNGYLVERISLEDYLPFEEVGEISKSEHLSTEIINHDFLVGWKVALAILKTTIRLRGHTSKEIIKEVIESLGLYMKEQYKTETAKKSDKKAILDFYNKKLEEVQKMEFIDASEIPVIETQPDPYDELIISISRVDKSEYERLKKFVSKLKRKPLPF